MTSQAQINANRENSRKSTGPRTQEGKRAVSQNAVKHGLFAREAVIKCEDPAAYEVHREALLDELSPVGAIESMLAERIVSLSWRLLRVERMQNQATDCLIEEDYLPLGRMITKRWSGNLKIIEKLFMHERRIESSLNRTITKLKKLQVIRRTVREDAQEQLFAQAVAAELNNINFAKQSQSPAFGGKLEARNPKSEMSGAYGENFAEQSQKPAFGGKSEARISKSETSGAYGENFAEQSQFAPDLMGSTSFMKRDYDDTAHLEGGGNKANLERRYPTERPKIERGGRSLADERTIR